MTTATEVRGRLVEALQLDLVGPGNDHAFAAELLPEAPSRWYLTGFLVPVDAPAEQRTDEQAQDEIDTGGDSAGSDDAEPPDRGAAKRSFLPSSLGLTFLVPRDATQLTVTAAWGDYAYERGGKVATDDDGGGDGADSDGSSDAGRRGYRRLPRTGAVMVPLTTPIDPDGLPVPESGGLKVVVSVRPVRGNPRVPDGTRSISVFLVNRRRPHEKFGYRAFAFQAALEVTSDRPFVPRPDPRWAELDGRLVEWDDRVADLHYRDVCEFVVGHGVSGTASVDQSGECSRLSSTWIPTAEVERVTPPSMPGVQLGMEALADLADADAVRDTLGPLVTQYREWIEAQSSKLTGLEPARRSTAVDLLTEAGNAERRIESGIAALADSQVLHAFALANRAMAMAARRREAQRLGIAPESVAPPSWRPFQLAFFLMSLRGLADPLHAEREIVDLLFFPTGGGKTEAYLGLAAFTMVLRRLRHAGRRSGGVAVLMRYTLRLLTLDQLGRAAALVCALELLRGKDSALLGEWPFEVGLWVGSAATPNRMGHRGYDGPGAEYTAYRRVNQYRADSSRGSPIPVETCPWCGTKLAPRSFWLGPNPNKPENLWVICSNPRCDFTGDRHLPMVTVDEPLYRRLPAFLIATVDKFAALPWTGEVGSLFGWVTRADDKGFLGPMSGDGGTDLGGPLPPPELIIQDELHLISGPLGTIAGVYEAAIEALCVRSSGDAPIRPKIVASTATVRRADSQIRALFGRDRVGVFPPPGPDRRDSFFARTESREVTPARQYVGVAAQGRSLKVVLLRASLALLSASEKQYLDAGGTRVGDANPADPYMTLLGYFNSLRELGGSRRIVEDEVKARLEQYGRRRRLEPDDRIFTDRTIGYDPVELTSRVSTSKVSDAKRRLALAHHSADHVDVALATNMISVGLDISRIGLLVVLGQPKSSAEYIQATSRVGRQADKPGLVVTLLNVHKPRDRSHYERFSTYHAGFYRAVEATSVTPFSPRALDRALAPALVGLCRHGRTALTPALGAGSIAALRADLDTFAQVFADRSRRHRAMSEADADKLSAHVRGLAQRLLDAWVNVASRLHATNTQLQYQKEVGGAAALLRDFFDPDLAMLPPDHQRFRANRSMRDVEASVELLPKALPTWD